jgi:hypothetical protein
VLAQHRIGPPPQPGQLCIEGLPVQADPARSRGTARRSGVQGAGDCPGEYQAAVTAGRPWPPARTPQPEPERLPEPDSSPKSDPQADDQSGPHDRAARLDEMLAQAAEAAQHLAAENAGREARAEYAAQLRREAAAEPEHTAQPQASYEAEIEM